MKYMLEPIYEITNHWSEKEFSLGLDIYSEGNGAYREYRLLIGLGFIQIALGFSI